MNIGLIGAGVMGSAIGARLLASGCTLVLPGGAGLTRLASKRGGG